MSGAIRGISSTLSLSTVQRQLVVETILEDFAPSERDLRAVGAHDRRTRTRTGQRHARPVREAPRSFPRLNNVEILVGMVKSLVRCFLMDH